MSSGRIRIGIDTGGTFTDFALSRDGVFHTTKKLTTHQAPEQAIMQGLDDLMGATGCRPTDAELIIHGTTLATNAVIEHKGAKVAMLTTEGFRDVLEMGSESRFDQYDLSLTKPLPWCRDICVLPFPNVLRRMGANCCRLTFQLSGSSLKN